jgi:hypothetical protein
LAEAATGAAGYTGGDLFQAVFVFGIVFLFINEIGQGQGMRGPGGSLLAAAGLFFRRRQRGFVRPFGSFAGENIIYCAAIRRHGVIVSEGVIFSAPTVAVFQGSGGEVEELGDGGLLTGGHDAGRGVIHSLIVAEDRKLFKRRKTDDKPISLSPSPHRDIPVGALFRARRVDAVVLAQNHLAPAKAHGTGGVFNFVAHAN